MWTWDSFYRVWHANYIDCGRGTWRNCSVYCSNQISYNISKSTLKCELLFSKKCSFSLLTHPTLVKTQCRAWNIKARWNATHAIDSFWTHACIYINCKEFPLLLFVAPCYNSKKQFMICLLVLNKYLYHCRLTCIYSPKITKPFCFILNQFKTMMRLFNFFPLGTSSLAHSSEWF